MQSTCVITAQDAITFLQMQSDKSIDAIITDVPYGITSLECDRLHKHANNIALNATFWEEVWRVTNVFITSCVQPVTSQIVIYQLEKFKHTYVWVKNKSTRWLLAGKAPLRIHEDIIVLSNGQHTYNPQKTKGHKPYVKNKSDADKQQLPYDGYGKFVSQNVASDGERFPNSLLLFDTDVDAIKNSQDTHPTQKPVSLMEFLVSTYTNENDIVCDPFLGSGSTAVAAKRLNRNFIGCDINSQYVAIAQNRISMQSLEFAPSAKGYVQLNMFDSNIQAERE